MALQSALQVNTPGDREIIITRAFNAPREKVFECFTKPALVSRWMLGPPGWTMPVCTVDLRVGGRYRFEWRGEDGRSMGMTGTFREIVPNEKLVSTEIFDEDWTGGEAFVELTFAESQGTTLATYFVTYSSQQARDGAIATGMADGMEMSFKHLDDVLAGQA
jgi:uncharacterized protein YndB with AHSA1/START domain